MNTTIGIYDDHDAAVAAVGQLKDAGYAVNQLSIIGLTQTEVVDENDHVIPENPISVAGLGTGVALGTAVGVLTGVGIFAIPGLGFLFGAGALVGAIAGFDFGLIGGGIASVLTTVGVNDENAKRYDDVLRRGKFLVVAEGTAEEVLHARDLLQGHAINADLAIHGR